MSIDDGRVVSNFILQALRGEDLTLFGDGSQTRSFCYVSDLVEGLVRLMESSNISGPINLGNEHEVTIRYIAELVIAKVNSKSDLIYLPLPSDDPKQRKPDTSKAQELLGWKAGISLDQGLNSTIDYFRTKV